MFATASYGSTLPVVTSGGGLQGFQAVFSTTPPVTTCPTGRMLVLQNAQQQQQQQQQQRQYLVAGSLVSADVLPAVLQQQQLLQTQQRQQQQQQHQTNMLLGQLLAAVRPSLSVATTAVSDDGPNEIPQSPENGMPSLVDEGDDLEVPSYRQHHDPRNSTAPLRVSGKTRVSGLAGAIAKRLRLKLFVAVEAMGAESVATTAVALALAKMFVAQANLALLVQVESITAPPRDPSSPRESDHPGLRFVVHAWRTKTSPTDKEPLASPGLAELLETNAPSPQVAPPSSFDIAMRVPEDSQVAKVAGAIAKLMRGSGALGKTICLRPTASAASLNVTAKSIALTRTMLQGDNYDIYCRPCFENESQRQFSSESELVLGLYLIERDVIKSDLVLVE